MIQFYPWIHMIRRRVILKFAIEKLLFLNRIPTHWIGCDLGSLSNCWFEFEIRIRSTFELRFGFVIRIRSPSFWSFGFGIRLNLRKTRTLAGKIMGRKWARRKSADIFLKKWAIKKMGATWAHYFRKKSLESKFDLDSGSGLIHTPSMPGVRCLFWTTFKFKPNLPTSHPLRTVIFEKKNL